MPYRLPVAFSRCLFHIWKEIYLRPKLRTNRKASACTIVTHRKPVVLKTSGPEFFPKRDDGYLGIKSAGSNRGEKTITPRLAPGRFRFMTCCASILVRALYNRRR